MAYVVSNGNRRSAIATSSVGPAVTASRIPELDGLRGLMTLFVLFSHYFVEVPHGIGRFSLGWVAVIVFFVLSGYLVGQLIIERKDAGNFLAVFYLRRICRTFPSYFVVCAVLLVLVAGLGQHAWVIGRAASLPGWSYFVFLQNIFVLTRESYGQHWLSPSWTLALEEQFYLVAPLLFLFAPRRFWLAALMALCLGGLVLRAIGIESGLIAIAPLNLLPSSMDVLSIGLILAVLVKEDRIDWARWSVPLRVAPIVLLFATALTQRLDGGVVGSSFQVLGPTFIAIAAALFILTLVKGAPEARRFRSTLLRFFGSISYSLYLTHLAVLGLLHGLILGAEPDASTAVEFAVTIAALPIAVALAWALTRFLEGPITAFGRSFRWR